MLTADLAQSWQRGGRIGPRLLDREDADYLRDATALIALFSEHEGLSRAELEGALSEYVGVGTDYRILRGLIKLLMDRCRFETASAAEPAAIRRALFLRARALHPVSDEAARAQAVAETALEVGCAPEDVLAGLYADLPAQQKLLEFDPLTAREFIDLYNLAQAQALLYRCIEMRLFVEPNSAEGLRALFGAIKAYRLIHTIKGDAARGYEVRLDGPVSLFHRSQKYGVQMAVFLPALLLCTGWRLSAEIARKPGQKPAVFELKSDQTELRSHYLDALPYENPVREKFAERWERLDTPWVLEPSYAVIDLGGSVFIPDYTLRHPEGHLAHLEILGFWTPRHLQERLAACASAGFRDFILAAWDELRGSRDPLPRVPPHTIIFKRSLDPATIELAAEKLVAGEENF